MINTRTILSNGRTVRHELLVSIVSIIACIMLVFGYMGLQTLFGEKAPNVALGLVAVLLFGCACVLHKRS